MRMQYDEVQHVGVGAYLEQELRMQLSVSFSRELSECRVLDYFTVVITRNIAVLDNPALHNVSVPAEARTNSLKQTKSSTAAIEAQKELRPLHRCKAPGHLRR